MKRTETIVIRVTPAMKARLKDLAGDQGLSAFVRALLKYALKAVVLVWLSACGRETGYAGFESEVRAFEAVSGDMVSGVVIEFGESDTPARCRTKPFSTPRIIVSAERWRFASPARRELIIFHELGHCLYGMGHVEDRPHIMNPVIEESTYYHRRSELIAAFLEER